jgi:hypothetical protein
VAKTATSREGRSITAETRRDNQNDGHLVLILLGKDHTVVLAWHVIITDEVLGSCSFVETKNALVLALAKYYGCK